MPLVPTLRHPPPIQMQFGSPFGLTHILPVHVDPKDWQCEANRWMSCSIVLLFLEACLQPFLVISLVDQELQLVPIQLEFTELQHQSFAGGQ